MIKKNTAGLEYVLRHAKTNADAVMNETVFTFRNEPVGLLGGSPPEWNGSTGKISILKENASIALQVYPSVCDLKWVKL